MHKRGQIPVGYFFLSFLFLLDILHTFLFYFHPNLENLHNTPAPKMLSLIGLLFESGKAFGEVYCCFTF